MLKFIKIFTESIRLAVQELITNKLRSLLSLLGITIGIFCIISIFTGVDFLNDSINNSIKSLGTNTIYIEKWPWGGADGNYPWWEYNKRPEINYEDYEYLEKNLEDQFQVGYTGIYFQFANITSKYGRVNNISMNSYTENFHEILNLEPTKGRFYTLNESRKSNVVLLGANIAEELFPNVSSIDQVVRINGKQYKVIGVLDKTENLIDFTDFRNEIFIPNASARKLFGAPARNAYQYIVVSADDMNVDQLKDNIRGAVRSTRGLRPTQPDNFALNQITIILEAIASAQGTMRMAGLLLGGLSLLIGGFGVANIMFVSVKERTKYIGIKKAIGAKKWVIMTEFLIEAVFLCILGSLIGLALVWLLAFIGSQLADLNFVLTIKNIGIGIGISMLIGVVAGVIPAYLAANMNPVKAIRS